MWTIAVAVACVALYLLWRYHPRYGGNPGLPSFPIVGCLPLILLNKHRFYEWSCEVFESAHALTHLVFMGSHTTIATADPRNVYHILKSRFDFYPKGPNFYPYFHDIFGVGIFNSDGPIWRFQRKVASHIFTSNSLKDFVVDIADAEICRRLIPALEFARKDQSGCPLDLQALFMDFTFDTISQLTFGVDPVRLVSCKFIKSRLNGNVQHVEVGVEGGKSNCIDCSDYIQPNGQSLSSHAEDGRTLQRESGVSYMKVPGDLIQGFAEGFPAALHIIANRFLTPKFVWQAKRRLNIGSEKKLRHALKAVNKFATFVIEKSKNENSRRKDLLAMFMQVSKTQVASLLEGEDDVTWKENGDNEEGQALSDSLLKDILLSFILAGRETVASGITFLIWQICLYPEVEEAIHEEIKRILKDRQLNKSGAKEVGTFAYEEIRKMHYLHAALSESMRLFPPIPSDPKYAAEDDVLPDGTKVQKGYEVSYNVFAMGRARQVWGDDCLKFKPERWLGEDGAFVAVSPFKYPVFQAGLRTCLGKDFAYIQIKQVVASLVRDYKISLSPGFKPKLSFSINMLMTNGLPVILHRRQNDAAS
ncbi:hypothetical protein GOP47_0009032 [Adiantum capillus-veneris]|uniref:Cytochrome P450 n=1 Tax=Adiantum capillus-veneris TaxID=13818 RepID=A0A9D4V096_ADICA|nr:hypothetical protein GOP47_0009032 [Adiantum capillus-veneris]